MNQRNLPSLPVRPQPAPFEFDEYPQAPRDDVSLRSLTAMLRRHRLLIASSILVMVVLVGAYTKLSRPAYESTSQLRFEEEQLNLPQLVEDLSSDNRISTDVEVLQNRSSAVGVIDSLGLRAQVTKPRAIAASSLFSVLHVAPSADSVTLLLTAQDNGQFTVERGGTHQHLTARVGDTVHFGDVTFVARQTVRNSPPVELHVATLNQAVKSFESSLKVDRPSRDADLITISVRNRDPVRAAAAANLMAEQLISGRQHMQHTRTGSAVGFLNEQLDTLGDQLRTAEAALASYGERAAAVAPDEQAKTQVGRLAQIQADRGAVVAERDALAALVHQMDSAAAVGDTTGGAPSSRLISFPTLFRNQAASELLGSLAQVQNERAELLTRRTPQDPDVQVLTSRIHEIDRQLRGIAETYLQGLDNQVASLNDVAKQFGSALDSLPAKEVETARLQRDVQVRQDLYTLIQTRLKEAEIADAVVDPTVSIVDRAVVADKPVRPRPMLNLALSLVLGSMIGVAGAIGREMTDHSIRSRADALEASGLPILAAVPHLRHKGRDRLARTSGTREAAARIQSALVTLQETPAAYVESFNQLHANLVLSYQEQPLKVLVFTSPLPGEGKTLSAVNYALTLAGRGRRVLLIDADLRCGLVNEVFGVHRGPGCTEVLSGTARPEDVERRVSVGDGKQSLTLITSGTRTGAAGRLLTLERVRQLIAAVAPRFDAVVIDSPPINLLADASLLGAAADGVVLVVRTGHTRVEELSYAMEQLSAAHAPVVGTMLNDIDIRRRGDDESYGYLARVEQYADDAAESAAR